jgi:glycosyltransferase involved in cell wall biosynthesis
MVSLTTEIILVDDGSSDETAKKIIGEFGLHQNLIVKVQTNRERGAARNLGTSVASGKYITFLDSDDIPKETFAEDVTTRLRGCSEPIVAFRFDFADQSGRVIGLPIRSPKDQSQIWRENFLGCQGVFLRSDVAKAFPFSEDRNLSGLEDWELWLRILAVHRIKIFPITCISLRQHENRSMNQMSQELILRKADLLIAHAEQSLTHISDFSMNIRKLKAALLTLAAVYPSKQGNSLGIFKMLIDALLLDLYVLRTKRFYAALAKLAKLQFNTST